MQKYLSHADLDTRKRRTKAHKILKILEFIGVPRNAKVLEIGTGSGIIANELSHFFKVYSLDIVDERIISKGFNFKLVKNTNLPFNSNFFDLIISNQVIEHVDNHDNHLKEIFRCLKKGGLCYLATPNKYAIFEAHYHLPFLSWLPKKAANLYLKLIKKRKYDVNCLSYNNIIKLFQKNGFTLKHFTFKILRKPSYFNLDQNYLIYSKILNKVPSLFDRVLKYIIPSWIFILKK